MGTGWSITTEPAFAPFCSWTHAQAEDLLRQYQLSSFSFGIDHRELSFLTGESTTVAKAIVAALIFDPPMRALEGYGVTHCHHLDQLAKQGTSRINALTAILGVIAVAGSAPPATTPLLEVKLKLIFRAFDFGSSTAISKDEASILLESLFEALTAIIGRTRGARSSFDVECQALVEQIYERLGKKAANETLGEAEFVRWALEWLGPETRSLDAVLFRFGLLDAATAAARRSHSDDDMSSLTHAEDDRPGRASWLHQERETLDALVRTGALQLHETEEARVRITAQLRSLERSAFLEVDGTALAVR